MAVEAVVAEGLACQRGGRPVVSGISFEVRAGSAVALRGPNGSGKTTLLRTIAGYLQPYAGTFEVRRPPHSVSLPKGREDARTVLQLGERAAAPSPSPSGRGPG